MKRLPTLFKAFYAGVLVLSLSGLALAAQISFSSVSGNWRDPVDSNPGSTTGDPVITNGSPKSIVRWGTPSSGGTQQSGYDFSRALPGPQTLPPAPTPLFPLGEFTHQNFPVNGASLTSIKLDVILNLTVDGAATQPLTFTFTFNHVETPNTTTPCPYATPSGEGCTDRVTFVSAPQPTTFNIGGVAYTLSMSFVDDNGIPVAQFLTRENLENNANLVGQFTVSPPVTCGDGTCNSSETCTNCSQDCGDCPPPGSTPSIQFNASAYTAGESAGNATITVTRNGTNLTGASSVQYATSNGTALAGINYTATSGTLNFAANETSKTFSIPLFDDGLANGNKTVQLSLTSPTGATLGSPNTAVLTLIDAGTTPPPPGGGTPAVQFSAIAYNTAETAGTTTITVMRTGSDLSATSTVQYATSNGTALAGTHYTAASGTLTFNPNQTSRTFTISILDDGVSSGNKTVQLALSAPSAATLGNPSNAVLTIVDAGGPPPGGGTPPSIVSGPSANPNPTFTQTTTLNILGNTSSTGGQSVLTYTWSLSGTNPASNVTFSNNGTNAGKTSVATFPMAGTYRIRATVKDTVTNGTIDSSTIDVVVVRDPKSIAVSPADQTYTIGLSQPLNLSAEVKDQWGVVMTNKNPSWFSTGGSLSPTGLAASFSNQDLNLSRVTVTASLLNGLNTTITGSAMVTIVKVGGSGFGNLSLAKVYPVPYKSSSGLPGINFTGLPIGTKIRIYSPDGRLVNTLDVPNGGEKVWEVNNSNGNRVASDVYIYIMEGGGDKKKGKLVVIQ